MTALIFGNSIVNQSEPARQNAPVTITVRGAPTGYLTDFTGSTIYKAL